MPNELVPITKCLRCQFRKFIPEAHPAQAKRTVTEIQNAWEKAMHIDERSGMLYISADKIHSILRVGSKANAQYIVQTIPNEVKQEIEGQVYIAAYEVMKLLEKRILEVGSTTRQNLVYCQRVYHTIRDLPEIELLQQKCRDMRRKIVKELKAKRIKKYKIKYDELTGEPLNKKTSEFSHIRSQFVYVALSTNIQNGLIVNKEVHDRITQNDIHDEGELYALCEKMGWNLSWYEPFVKILT
ncbi:MAG: hypothetical protein ACRCW2_07270 [Cellulosilyticaceae bacterium]